MGVAFKKGTLFKEKCNSLKLFINLLREPIRYSLISRLHPHGTQFTLLLFAFHLAIRSLNPLKQEGFDFDKIYSGLRLNWEGWVFLWHVIDINNYFLSKCWKCLHKFVETAWLRAWEFSVVQYTMFRFPAWFGLHRFRVWHAEHDKSVSKSWRKIPAYMPVYVCVSTFDRAGLFETLCLFSSSFSKIFEWYFWYLILLGRR